MSFLQAVYDESRVQYLRKGWFFSTEETITFSFAYFFVMSRTFRKRHGT